MESFAFAYKLKDNQLNKEKITLMRQNVILMFGKLMLELYCQKQNYILILA